MPSRSLVFRVLSSITAALLLLAAATRDVGGQSKAPVATKSVQRATAAPRATATLAPRATAIPIATANSAPTCADCPDLVVESCKLYCIHNGDSWLNPPLCPTTGLDPDGGYQIEIRGTVKNAGTKTGTFPGGVLTDNKLDGNPSDSQLWGSNRSFDEVWLAAGYELEKQGWFEVKIPRTAPLGTHTAVVRVDPKNLLMESNESNNFCKVQFKRIGTVVVANDLQVTGVTVSPASGPPATAFSFVVNVTNASGPTATSSVTCDRGAAPVTVSSLGTGQTKQVTVPINFPPAVGAKTVKCTVTIAAPGVETDYANNSKSANFTVTPP